MNKLMDKLMQFIEAVLVALIGTSVFIVVMQIVWRYVFRSPLGWTEQIARSEFIWIVMLGIPVMFNRGITMSFDVLLQKIRGKANKTIQIALRLIGMFFCGFYFVASVELCKTAANLTMAGVKMSVNVLYSAQPICAALLFLVFLRQIINLIRNFKKEEEDK
ncbi:MAG: TRAP transporter small permease [Oscillospiraceae bacterium]